jgi:HSP20 family protein
MKNEIIRRNELTPFRMLGEMEQEIDRMMDIFRGIPGPRFENYFFPSCEVSEKNGHYMINVDLPGIPRNEINVDLTEGKLHVYGERKSEHKEGNYTERRYGKYERTMTLPDNVSTKDAEAVFEDGVLTIALKKTGEPKIKKLEIGTKKIGGLWSRIIGEDKEISKKKVKSKKVA